MAEVRELKRGRRSGRAKEDHFEALKRAAGMAAEVLCDMMADERQFCRHTYADKSSGAVAEVMLEIRNVKQLRETIGAIRDLADAVRSLNGMLSPEEQSAAEIQLKKLKLEEKKLVAGEGAQSETGVVLLPAPNAEDGE